MRRTWSTFAGQIILIGVYETANELIRQAISQKGTLAGMENARQVAAFEQTHGFFVEPAWQGALEHTYHLLGISVGWAQLTLLANVLYALGHPIVLIASALWVFYFRTDLFSRMRNTLFICDALALLTYHIFPVAPPRATTGLTYNGRPFHFVDTLAQMIPSQRGNDEFAAMPSIHICYALIVGCTLAWALRPWGLRGLVLLYPVIMLVAVVVTANHYLMDGVGGVIVFGIAATTALTLYWARHGLAFARRHQRPVPLRHGAPGRRGAASEGR
ncbi:MAG TPA: phosphatase PAP2 family protein [Chloroflexota bacterium]|jgi:membrane-associated phospholipid phosphatase